MTRDPVDRRVECCICTTRLDDPSADGPEYFHLPWANRMITLATIWQSGMTTPTRLCDRCDHEIRETINRITVDVLRGRSA